MRRLLLASVAALVVVPAALAQATTSTGTTTVPFGGTFSGCAGQAVVIEGETRITFHTTTDATGNVHVSTHSRTHGTGVGADGATYRLSGSDNAQTNGTKTSTGAVEFTTLTTAVVAGQGPSNNSRFFSLVHTTISATGDVTSEVIESSFMCPDTPPKS